MTSQLSNSGASIASSFVFSLRYPARHSPFRAANAAPLKAAHNDGAFRLRMKSVEDQSLTRW